MNENRVQYIDVAKGIAMICIILGRNWGETEGNISAESPCPFLIHITGTSGTVAVLSAFRRESSTKAGFSASGS